MFRLFLATTLLLSVSTLATCEEVFVTIQKVVGNRITFTPSSGGRGGMRGGDRGQAEGQNPADQGNEGGAMGRGRGRRGGFSRGGASVRPPGEPSAPRGSSMGTGRGRGRMGRGGGAESQPTTAIVPATAKITAASRERRTFEFRVGVELAGGLRHAVFTRMQQPLAARLVTSAGRITELNVLTDDTDINQAGTYSSGGTVIAVRPKRPPSK